MKNALIEAVLLEGGVSAITADDPLHPSGGLSVMKAQALGWR